MFPRAPVIPGALLIPGTPVIPGAPLDPGTPVILSAPLDPGTPVILSAPLDPGTPVAGSCASSSAPDHCATRLGRTTRPSRTICRTMRRSGHRFSHF
jgi:hypothetical protein